MNYMSIEGLFALILAAGALAVLGRFAYQHFYGSTPLSPVHTGKKHDHSCKYDQAEQRRAEPRSTPRIDTSNLPPADPKVNALLSMISTGSLETHVREITGDVAFLLAGKSTKMTGRNSYFKDLEVAMSYLEQYYASLGIKTTRHPYKVRGRQFYNLVAELPGSVSPEKVFIVGGHLDSTAGNPWRTEEVAPGADDDGSGTAGLMELAKLLVGVKHDYTIRIVHFTCEEQGLYGSYAYSDFCATQKTDIVAMIEMDMIGYCAKPGNRVDIHDDMDRNGSHKLVEIMVRGAKQYGLNLNVVDTHNHAVENRSDHAGFLDHGWLAVLVSDEFTDSGFNPNYHSKTDTWNTLNYPYMAEVVKMVFVAIVDLAKVKA